MDDASNKAITIAVGVFITIIITSGVLFSIGQMQEVYSRVYETDVSIQNKFDEYDTYVQTGDNIKSNTNIKTGIEVINAIKKYINSPVVKIYVDNGGNTGSTQLNILPSGKTNREYESWLEDTLLVQYNNAVPASNKISSIGEGLYFSTSNTFEGFTTIIFRNYPMTK